MPKGSAELTRARKDEIVAACRKLYETMSFREITLKEIGQQTSFTRTSIYNYFETKEEIFLALFAQEYDLFAGDLEALCAREKELSLDALSSELARALERRPLMLKLLSMNLSMTWRPTPAWSASWSLRSLTAGARTRWTAVSRSSAPGWMRPDGRPSSMPFCRLSTGFILILTSRKSRRTPCGRPASPMPI